MSVKITTTVNKFPEMERNIRIVDGKSITVGVKGENAWLASIHEYGCHIKITPKMRAWLHRNGFHVKDSTTEIVIPERSFLRTGYDTNRDKIVDRAERALTLVTDGTWTEDQFFSFVGKFIRDSIQDYAIELSSPPKHPFSLERNPGKENPLVVSGDMIADIEYEVE